MSTSDTVAIVEPSPTATTTAEQLDDVLEDVLENVSIAACGSAELASEDNHSIEAVVDKEEQQEHDGTATSDSNESEHCGDAKQSAKDDIVDDETEETEEIEGHHSVNHSDDHEQDSEELEDEFFDEHDDGRIASYDSDSNSNSHADDEEEEEIIDDGGDDDKSVKTISSEHIEMSDASVTKSASESKETEKVVPRPAKSSLRGRRPPPPPSRGDRGSFAPAAAAKNIRAPIPTPRRSVPPPPPRTPRGETEDGNPLYISNWGYRSNLIDQNGNFQRATTDLRNYIATYKAKYFYYFDLVNGRYPQFVRTLPNKMEIWRMSFNVYASGFSDYIAHLGEIHSFYQMEFVDNELRWVYKDFNFYPNKMRYGFRVNSFDIADVHSRFVKFLCLRDNIIKQFPYVNIQHKVFIGKKFEDNLRSMMNSLDHVKRETLSIECNASSNSSQAEEPVASTISTPEERVPSRTSSVRNDGDTGRRVVQTFTRFNTSFRAGPPSMSRRVLISSRPPRGNFRG